MTTNAQARNAQARKPLEFDEKLLEIIRRGAISRVTLHPLSYTDATALRMRLYRTKDKLRKHPHELSANAELIIIKLVSTNASTFAVIVQPRDMGFEKAYANAGIISSDSPPDLD